MARLKTFNNRRQSKQRIMEAAFAINRKRECKIIRLALAYSMTDRDLRRKGFSQMAIRQVRKRESIIERYSIGVLSFQQAFARTQLSAEDAARSFNQLRLATLNMADVESRIAGQEPDLVVIDEVGDVDWNSLRLT